jgi:hypothetical protein
VQAGRRPRSTLAAGARFRAKGPVVHRSRAVDRPSPAGSAPPSTCQDQYLTFSPPGRAVTGIFAGARLDVSHARGVSRLSRSSATDAWLAGQASQGWNSRLPVSVMAAARPYAGGAVEFKGDVLASGNPEVRGMLFWLGTACAGIAVTFWANTDVIHRRIARPASSLATRTCPSPAWPCSLPTGHARPADHHCRRPRVVQDDEHSQVGLWPTSRSGPTTTGSICPPTTRARKSGRASHRGTCQASAPQLEHHQEPDYGFRTGRVELNQPEGSPGGSGCRFTIGTGSPTACEPAPPPAHAARPARRRR